MAHREDRHAFDLAFREKALQPADEDYPRIKADPVQASREIVRKLRFRKAALNDDLTLGFGR